MSEENNSLTPAARAELCEQEFEKNFYLILRTKPSAFKGEKKVAFRHRDPHSNFPSQKVAVVDSATNLTNSAPVLIWFPFEMFFLIRKERELTSKPNLPIEWKRLDDKKKNGGLALQGTSHLRRYILFTRYFFPLAEYFNEYCSQSTLLFLLNTIILHSQDTFPLTEFYNTV